MAEVIKIKKGLDINLKGKAEQVIAKANLPEVYAVRPDDFQGVTPRLAVKEGTQVKVGTELFYDKENPDLKFVSPVSGVVTAVNRGDRRKLLDVQIKSDGKFESEDFAKGNPNSLSADDVKERLQKSGFAAFIRMRPYDVIANINVAPKAVFISAFDSSPLAPDYSFIFKNDAENIQVGIDALKKVSNAPVYVSISKTQDGSVFSNLKNVELNVFDGPHPAGNVGVQINHLNPINKGEEVWTVKMQTVKEIGQAFLTGKIDFKRIIALTGSEVSSPAYYETVYGASISTIVADKVSNPSVRYISGNALTGTKIAADGFIGAFDLQITVLPEANEDETLGWIMPRLNKFSVSRTYFSWLFGNKEYTLDTNVNGGERAIIVSNEYDKVFPFDIYPEYLVKATIAKNIDEMIQLGILEVAPEDFALCEFVDTSKLKLQQIIREGLDYLRKEEA